MVHPKDKQPKGRLSGVLYGVQCTDQDCKDSYIGETAQPLENRMSQHRRSSTSGNDSAVYSHLNASGHSFNTKDVHILDRETLWYERGVKEAILGPSGETIFEPQRKCPGQAVARVGPAAAVHDIAQYLTNSALSMQIEILSKIYKQCLIML